MEDEIMKTDSNGITKIIGGGHVAFVNEEMKQLIFDKLTRFGLDSHEHNRDAFQVNIRNPNHEVIEQNGDLVLVKKNSPWSKKKKGSNYTPSKKKRK